MKGSAEFRVSLALLAGQDDILNRQLSLNPDQTIPVGRSSKSAFKDLNPEAGNGYINSPVISREHAAFKVAARTGSDAYNVQVEDYGSMHGTYINGIKLVSHIGSTVFDNDVIRFGANVTRGKDVFMAPQYRVKIEQVSFSDKALLPGDVASPSTSHGSHLTTKDGYCVPESDTDSDSDYDPVSSVIYVDDDSDSDSDGDLESQASQSVIECAAPTSHNADVEEPADPTELEVLSTPQEIEDLTVDAEDPQPQDVEQHASNGRDWDGDQDNESLLHLEDLAELDGVTQDSYRELMLSDPEQLSPVAAAFTPPPKVEATVINDYLTPQSLNQVHQSLNVNNLNVNNPTDRDSMNGVAIGATNPTELKSLLSTQSTDAEVTEEEASARLQLADTMQSRLDPSTPDTDSVPQIIIRGHSYSATPSRHSKKRSFTFYLQEQVDDELKDMMGSSAEPQHASTIDDMTPAGVSEQTSGQSAPSSPQSGGQSTSPNAPIAIHDEDSPLLEQDDTDAANEATGPPRKRTRLHGVARTAGTVLASAVAGGVATFYALGLTPESLFA